MDETLEQQVARLTGQVSTLTTANSDLTGQLAGRTGELRSVNHKATFKALALEAGVKPKAVESLYRLSGYDPGEADDADVDAVSALIEASRDEHDYCFEPVEVIPPVTPVVPTVKAPVKPVALGGGRGKAPVIPDKFRATAANMADPKWLRDNHAALGAASKNGTLELAEII
jgi:hypothetical protein